MTKLTRFEAVLYIWENSQEIRHWYETQIDEPFDIDTVTAYNVNSFGLGAPGDIVSEIITAGVRDGIINESDDGEYSIPVIIPDLEKNNAFAGRGGSNWKARTPQSPTMQEIRTLDMDEVVDFVLQANDIGIDDDDYIFDEEGGYFADADAVIDELSYRRGNEEGTEGTAHGEN